LPSSLTEVRSSTWVCSTSLPVSVCGTGTRRSPNCGVSCQFRPNPIGHCLRADLSLASQAFALPAWTPLVSARGLPTWGHSGQTSYGWYRNIDLLSIGIAVWLILRPDYLTADQPCGETLRLSVAEVRTPFLCYSSRHSHSSSLHGCRLRDRFVARTTLPYHCALHTVPCVGGRLCPATLAAQAHSTSELLRTLSRVAASKPTSWLSGRTHSLHHSAVTWGP
jgi:hypothetical protein